MTLIWDKIKTFSSSGYGLMIYFVAYWSKSNTQFSGAFYDLNIIVHHGIYHTKINLYEAIGASTESLQNTDNSSTHVLDQHIMHWNI